MMNCENYVKKAADRIPDEVLSEVWFRLQHQAFEYLREAFHARRRADSEFNQAFVANRIGMDEGQLSKILSGNRNVTLRTLSNIACAIDHRLEVTLVDLHSICQRNEFFDGVNEMWHGKRASSTDTCTQVSRIDEDSRADAVEFGEAASETNTKIRKYEFRAESA